MPATVATRPRAVVGKQHPPFQSQLAAWYRYRQGVTAVNGACSRWEDATNQLRPLLQATASARPRVQSDGSLLFDGSDDYLQATFTLNQPCSIAIAFTQLTWTSGDIIFDGSTADMKLTQTGSTPAIQANAGSSLTGNSAIPVAVNAVASFYASGTASAYGASGGGPRVVVTGDAGANNPGGITVGAARGASNFSNIIVREILVYSGTLVSAQRFIIRKYLCRVGNVGGT